MTDATRIITRTFSSFFASAALCALLFAAVQPGAMAQDASFAAELSGAHEVPANASTADGTVAASLTGSTLTLSGSFSGLTSDFNADIGGGAHLHLAPAGRNGGVEIPLNASLAADNRSGTFESAENTFTLTNDQLEALEARRLYVNIHTRDMPSGEIRGQLVPAGAVVHHAVLSGRAEVPANTSGGVGGAIVELYDDEIVVTGSFEGLESDFNEAIGGGAHLHLAPIGENGDVEIALNAAVGDDGRSGTFDASENSFAISNDQRLALEGGDLYVNVHTEALPAGELRGQVFPPSYRVFEAALAGDNEIPAVSTTGAGGVLAVLNEDSRELVLTGDFRDLASPFDADIAGGAHIHEAPANENGPIDISLVATLDEDQFGGVFERAQNTLTLTEDQRESLFAGRYYVNVHTEEAPAGEVRGQLLPSTNLAPAAAVISAPDDGAALRLGSSEGELTVEWTEASDRNFNAVFYRWELSRDDAFSEPFYAATIVDPTLTLTYDSLHSVLTHGGFRAGQADSVYHRVTSSDGSLRTAGEGALLSFEMELPLFPRGIRLVELAQGLTSPVTLVESPDETGRLFIVDQAGHIRILHANGELQPEPFLDLTDRIVDLDAGFDERGLLGLAFHPAYASNGRFFVYY
ncbi:MAG: CHRD domain-containing protein, partial [Bacteroidota bacterium]